MTQNAQTLEAVLVLNDQMSGPIQKAQASVVELGKTFSTTQQKATAALKPITQGTAAAGTSVNAMSLGFDRATRAQANFVRRVGSVSNRLLALHFTAQQLGDSFGNGKGGIGAGIKIASSGLATFTGIVAAMPNPIGIAIGAIGGLLAVFGGVQQQITAIDEKSKKMTLSLKKNIKAVTDAAAGKDFEASKMSLAGKTPEQIETVAELEVQETRLLEVYKQQRQYSQELGVLEKTRLERETLDQEKLNGLLEKRAKLEAFIQQLEKNNAKDDIDAMVLEGQKGQLALLNKEIKDFEINAKKTAERVEFLNGKLLHLAGEEKDARLELESFNKALEGNEEMQGFVKEMSKLEDESFGVQQALNQNLITPLEAAEKQLDIVTKKLHLAFSHPDIAPQSTIDDLASQQLNRKYDVDVAADFAKIEKEQKEAAKHAQEEMKRAQDEYRREWESLFMYIGEGFSDVFADALIDGEDFTKGLGNLFKNLQKNLIKMIMNSILGNMFQSVGASFGNSMAPMIGALTGRPVGGGGGGVGASAGGGSANIAPGAGGLTIGRSGGPAPNSGMSAFSFGDLGETGNAALGLGAGIGTMAGGYVMQRGVSEGNVGMGVAGGALAGAAMGAMFGPVGIAVGVIAGAALGYFSANDAKKEEEKMKERQREMDEEARRQHEAMVEKAKGLIKMHVRNNMGGGLATEEAMKDVSGLLSGDISADEVEAFGAENVVARQGEIERQSSVDVGGVNINVTASVSGSYDVQRLAEELGFHMAGSIRSAAAGAGL